MRFLTLAAIVAAWAALPIQAGLVAVWQMNEGSGQNITDSSTNHLNGYFYSQSGSAVPVWSANGGGHSGNSGDYALSFPVGTLHECGRVDSTALLTPASGRLTLTADIKPYSWHQGVIVSKHAGGTTGSYMLDVATTNGQLLFMVINSSGTRVNLGWQPPAGDVNSWHQLAGTYDGAMMRLYYDGVLRAQTAQTGAIQSVSSPVLIGEFDQANTSWEYEGLIDNAGLLDEALSDGGVAIGAAALPGSGIYQLYTQGAASFPTSGGGSSWSGRVFVDANGNGAWDSGEPGVAGVGVSDTVNLVLTGADGTYTLANAATTPELLHISLPSGYAKSGTWYRKITAGSPPADFNFALSIANESQPFDFVQITDLHIGASGTKALLTQGLAQVAALKTRPAFILATGDLTDAGGTLSQYDDYTSAVNASAIRVFSVFGNHDANAGTTGNYRNYLGPDYYSFSYGDCHFVVLNSVYKTADQQAWLAKDLQLVRGSKRLFIFQHYSPSAQEHADYASYNAKAVFSGHWHSQHTVQVGNTASYNTANFLFGGIDCSPAGFKIMHVEPSAITTRMKWLADGKQLQIVMPDDSLLMGRGGVQILVNAYETSAEVQSVHYQLNISGGGLVTEGFLVRDGQWSWAGTIPEAMVSRGGYDLQVTATNDNGEASTASTSFLVLGMGPRTVLPSQDWPQFGGGPQRGGAVSTALHPPLGPLWRHQTGGTLDFASPVVKDQRIYVGVKDRNDFDHNGVLALHAADGSQEWFAATPAAVSHSVAVDDARVYACSHGGVLHALSRTTGQQAWSAVLGSAAQRFQYAAPVLAGGKVYAGSFAWFGCFDPATGAESWHQTYGADWISSNACPAVSGNVVVVGANWQPSNLSLKAVNASTGATLWQFTNQGLHGSPVIAGDKIVFTDYNGQITCANLSNGQQVWTHDLGGGRSASTPAVAFGIVVAGGTGSIKGYRLSDGQQLWDFSLTTSALKMAPYNNGFAALAGSPTIADHIAYVPCGDGRLYALTLETGQLQWSMKFGTPLLSAPCISGQVMYLTAYDGNVYALASGEALGYNPPDFDGDDDVDQADFGYLQTCLGTVGAANCGEANLNADGGVDQADLDLFVECYAGPDQPRKSGCMGS